MKATAKDWAERVRVWRESGQTAAAFAAGKGFREKTLVWWSGELDRRSRRQTKSVTVARAVPVSRGSTPLVVAIGAVRIEVRAGFDSAILRELVEALGATR